MHSIKEKMSQMKLDKNKFEKTLAEVNRPANLLNLTTERVFKLTLPTDEIPVELRREIKWWPITKFKLCEEEMDILHKLDILAVDLWKDIKTVHVQFEHLQRMLDNMKVKSFWE